MLRVTAVLIALTAMAQTAFATIGPGDGVLIVTAGVTAGETRTDKEMVSGANWFVNWHASAASLAKMHMAKSSKL